MEVVVGDVPPGRPPDPRFVLAEDLDALTAAGPDGSARTVRLAGPYDPYLQLRDRELLIADEARRKVLGPVLGRPGAIVADGEVAGTWRPRASGRKLTVRIEPGGQLSAGDRALVQEQTEHLAVYRGSVLGEIAFE